MRCIEAIEAAGATVIDLDAAGFEFAPADGEFLVLVYEFRDDLRNYLATRTRVPLAGKTLADAIAFNEANADREMPFFAQEIFELANSLAPGPDDPQPAFGSMTYNQALEIDRLSGVNGIDKALADFDLDAVIAPTDNPAWATDLLYGDRFLFGSSGLAAGAGYPIVQVPASMVFGAPLGISFFGTAFSEPTLIKLASGFEAVTRVRARESADLRVDAAGRSRGWHDARDGRARQGISRRSRRRPCRRKRGRGARGACNCRDRIPTTGIAAIAALPTRDQRLRIDSATGVSEDRRPYVANQGRSAQVLRLARRSPIPPMNDLDS